MKPPALHSFNPEASAKLGPLLVIPVIAFSPSPMPKAEPAFFILSWLPHIIFNHLDTIWASLVAQMVESPPAMWETWVRSLSWEDPLEEGVATHLPGETPWTEEPRELQSRGHKEADMTE